MIDLHIHTKYSDGTDDVITILKKAEKLGLDAISITDHDTCKAYDELTNINVPNYYSGKIIPGCELICIHEGIPVEILAFNIDTAFLSQWLNNQNHEENYRKAQERQLDQLKESAKKIGLIFDPSLKLPSKRFAADILCCELRKYKYNFNILPKKILLDSVAFYRQYVCNPNSPLYFNESNHKPPIQEVIQAIKQAGGLAFLAHLFIYLTEDKKSFLESICNTCNIDGIEVYYSTYTKEETKFLANFCQKNNLYMCGGSDYHGTLKPGISLGTGFGNLHVPKEAIAPWENF
jgi:predicted metal-dependent phosphoesterase TrpH